MKEVDLQKLAVDAVNEHGGLAFKLSNRFLGGIPDLFVQLPGLPSALVEVKIARISKDRKVAHFDITPLQWKVMDQHVMAGGLACLLSFAKFEKGWAIQTWAMEKEVDGSVHKFSHKLNAHVLLQRGKREEQIVADLKRSIEWQVKK